MQLHYQNKTSARRNVLNQHHLIQSNLTLSERNDQHKIYNGISETKVKKKKKLGTILSHSDTNNITVTLNYPVNWGTSKVNYHTLNIIWDILRKH